MKQLSLPTIRDDKSIEDVFKFKTFGDLAQVFGAVRAARLLRTARAKQGRTETLTAEEIEVTRYFLGLSKVPDPGRFGPRFPKALKAFRAFVQADPANRASVARFLQKVERRLAEKEAA